MKSVLLCSVALLGLSWSAATAAQNTTDPQPPAGAPSSASPSVSPGAATPTTSAGAADTIDDSNTIIVTATKRRQALSDVPIAVSAISAAQLQNSGATDIRALNQLSPSLLVSSTSSESSGGAARIRGIGTIGDNPGLESSVAVFIDGVYRNRSGAGLTELGEIERIEVLRGPQGTLFGRNASAGLLNIVTKQPEFEAKGGAEFTYGNYNFIRAAGGITGSVFKDIVAARIDGVYVKRDGFLQNDERLGDKRDFNNRQRFLVRGQLLVKPIDDLSIRIIGDYTKRDEECCAATYDPAVERFRTADGSIGTRPNGIANIIRGLGGIVPDDTFDRRASVTPGVDYRSAVEDWGASAEVNWDLGGVNLTSITGYRNYTTVRGQDADYINLDILRREAQDLKFETFSQELRLQGRLFDNKLDFLVGAYFANEDLSLDDDLAYGNDYVRYANCLVANSFTAITPALLSPANASTTGCVNQAVAAQVLLNPALPAATRGLLATFSGLNPALGGLAGFDAIAAAVGQPGNTLNGRGVVRDSFRQNSRNFAFFTHNVLNITDRLSVTVGARYTNELKRLKVDLLDNNTLCAAIRGSATLSGLATLPCVIPAFVGGSLVANDRKPEHRVTGTASVSFKPTDELLTYFSYSKGYKAGGFNLDRSALNAVAPNLDALTFEPEVVDAFELGAKLDLRQFKLNVAVFRSVFESFQLNTFNGINFIVENINACDDDLGVGGTCPGKLKGGVRSQGVEVEASLFPVDDLGITVGYTLADTEYRRDLVGIGGRALATPLFVLPGNQVSNAPNHVVTASIGFNPEINAKGWRALFYLDGRYQSRIRTGSDLFPEKNQQGFAFVNGRVGIQGPDRLFSVELWAQNLLDEDTRQIGFNAPLQGSNTQAGIQQGLYASSNTLFGQFLGEPRTFGVTVRTQF